MLISVYCKNCENTITLFSPDVLLITCSQDSLCSLINITKQPSAEEPSAKTHVTDTNPFDKSKTLRS